MRSRLAPILIAASVLACGCETFGPRTCDPSAGGNPSITYNGGTVQGGVYMSSAWDGELLYFPGGMHYTLVHGLGATPGWVQTYLSFHQYGTADSGALAQAAGNQVEIVQVDDQVIEVGNDSCVTYWLLVSAGVGDKPGD